MEIEIVLSIKVIMSENLMKCNFLPVFRVNPFYLLLNPLPTVKAIEVRFIVLSA